MRPSLYMSAKAIGSDRASLARLFGHLLESRLERAMS